MSAAFLPENDQAPELKTLFETGAVRSADRCNERYDLITPIGLRRVAQTYHEGSKKYDDFNWEKGMPISDMLNHAIPHIYAYLAGDRSEDHLAHAAWNLLAALHSEELWPELNANLRPANCKLATHVAEKHHAASQAPVGTVPSESPSLEYNPVIVSDYDPSIRTIALDLAPKDQPIDFPSGVYQLFGGEHQYNGEIRFIDDKGIVYLFENNLMRKVGGIGGIAYTSGVTYDYICKTIQEFNTKGQPTLAKTLVDKHQSSPENIEIIS